MTHLQSHRFECSKMPTTHCGVSRLGCQAGGVASDQAVLLVEPAGTLQDAVKVKHTDRKYCYILE